MMGRSALLAATNSAVAPPVFGARFSDPGTLPPNFLQSSCFSPSGSAIVIGAFDSLFGYQWSSSGFGARISSPASGFPGTPHALAFSPSGDRVAGAHRSTPFIAIWSWSASGFGPKFANPATLPTSTSQVRASGIKFSPAGDSIVAALNTSPFVAAYSCNSTAFIAKLSNPGTAIPGQGRSVSFSPSGDAVAIGTDLGVSVYAWTSSGFGTKFANPAALVGSGQAISFSPLGDVIMVNENSFYPWSATGFGTKFTSSATLPAGARQAAWLPGQNGVLFAHDSSPFVSMFSWSASGIGAKASNPSSLPTGNCYTISVTPLGDAVAVGGLSSPYINAYRIS